MSATAQELLALDNLGCLAGDVCGSDAEAARLTSLARQAGRVAAVRFSSPDVVVGEVNAALLKEHASSPSVDHRFITALLGYVTARDGDVEVLIACAGHLPPLVVRRDRVEYSAVRGPLPGVLDDVSFEPCSIRLTPGDALVLYTDGITEARGRTRAPFGEEGLSTLVEGSWGVGSQVLAELIEGAAVDYESGVTSDDIAVLVIAAPPTLRRSGNVLDENLEGCPAMVRPL